MDVRKPRFSEECGVLYFERIDDEAEDSTHGWYGR
jgi:hypothetical protein